MNPKNERIEVKVDGYTRVCLTATAVLLTVLIVGLWATRLDISADAHAAQPFGDSGEQRQEFIALQRETNSKLGELVSLLRSGEAKVQLVDKAKADGGKNAARGDGE
jgi:hypothetical protein